MKQVEFSSNEQLTANREVNILSKESSSTTRINFDDSNDDDAESEISENENIDETEMKKSRVTTSPNKKKRSLIVKKNKSDGSVPKRRCPNNPNESTHVDVEDLDTETKQTNHAQTRSHGRIIQIDFKKLKKIAKAMIQKKIPVILDLEATDELPSNQQLSSHVTAIKYMSTLTTN
ncbi:unnamed protein product [Rotaria magnacalcarata]|uniref:Uncharacterized protein n=1 Tax=Rotaria magnacalcarata TaxID=392030 RepID=A0A820EP80_9BILA|nr:unnamed protein product [Rotaria magnacalcarata]